MSIDGFVIAQPAGQRTLALRESYLAICDGDACEAHLLNAQERWYAYKLKIRNEARGRNKSARQGAVAPDADEALWVRMSATQWAEELLGIYNEKTIRTKLASLVERGLVATRANPTRGWDRTPQWLFNRATVQEVVNQWESSRPVPDLDPSEADAEENRVGKHLEDEVESIRKNVRMQSDKVPNGDGQSSESIRTNVRSNNTGILNRDLLQESPTGVSHVTENARKKISPAAPVNEQSLPAHTTSEASLSKELETVSEPRASVAVLPPNGGAANAAITDSELEFLFGANVEGPQEMQQVKSGKKVPGGVAGLLIQPVGRGNALHPVDREKLLERPLAVPSDTTYRLVKSLIGGNKAIDDGILDTLTPAGALPRRDWLRLTEEELIEARRVAQAEAQVEKLNFYTCAIRGLDVLIGAPVGQTGQRGAPTNAVVANAGCHAAAPHFEEADRSGDVGKFDAGAGWTRKADGGAVIIERTELVKRRSTEGLVYHLSDGRTCNALQLMTGYEFRGAEG